MSAAGLPVELQVTGAPRPLPPGADLAAYRVVQEGLTNVLRHAGRAAASVRVGWGEQLVITVSDDGRGGRPGDREVAAGADLASGQPRGLDAAAGRGLLGLRERLALYGGELAAGPRPGGGWQVRAVLPLGAARTGGRVRPWTSGARPLTVVIADDQALVRGGFRLILKAAGIDVVAEAADGEQAVAAVPARTGRTWC